MKKGYFGVVTRTSPMKIECKECLWARMMEESMLLNAKIRNREFNEAGFRFIIPKEVLKIKAFTEVNLN